MFNLKLQNIHFTSCVMKMVPGYVTFQGHLWVIQMRMPTDSTKKLSIEQQGGGSRKFLQSCLQRACHTALSNILSPDLASARPCNAGWNFGQQLQFWELCCHQDTTEAYTSLLACNSNREMLQTWRLLLK